MIEKARLYLQRHFGYETFRPGQQAIIEHVMSGENTIGIMPTGGGKSICYQIPSVMLPGVTLVISPLISLMKDQVDALDQAGISATFINSSLKAADINDRIQETILGVHKLLYIAPERLEAPSFVEQLRRLPISLVAVDEAHCISQWGHDFRPSYLRIRSLLGELTSKPVLLALTATATPQVQQDIMDRLEINADNTVVTGFERPNLSFKVIKGQSRVDFIVDYVIKNKSEAGIVYCATRKAVDHLYERLAAKGVAVGKYHAGLSAQQRDEQQERFLHDEITVMVATNAFGMGIDKSNVHYVIHAQIPKNMESYYQEAGRAGRDGLPSECILLHSEQDVQLQRYLIDQSTGDEQHKHQELQKLYGMRDYCHTQSCLQAHILKYFGEEDPIKCGRCNNCLDTRKSIDATKEAQMVLSCMKRMGERFGKTMIAQVLTGSSNKKVMENYFDKLPTYGLMKNQSIKEVSSFIDFLTSEQIIGITGGQFPLLFVTSEGKDVLLGKRIVLRKEQMQAGTIATDDPLFEHLRIVRKEAAMREGVPPYLIFSDQSLRDMCLKQPRTNNDFLQVKGVGAQKALKYGSLFLEAIETFLTEHEYEISKEVAAEPSPVKKKKAGTTNSHVETYELYRQGLSIQQICQERDLSAQTIESHLLRCVAEGMELDWSLFFTEEQERIINEAIVEAGDEHLKPIKELVPADVSYSAIKAALFKRRLGQVAER